MTTKRSTHLAKSTLRRQKNSQQPFVQRYRAPILLSVCGVLLVFMCLLAPILSPFATALVLAYMFAPAVDKLAKKMPRTLAVSLVLFGLCVLLLLALLVILPLLIKQTAALLDRLPQLADWAQTRLTPLLQQYLGLDAQFKLDASHTKQLLQQIPAKAALQKALPSLMTGWQTLLGLIGNLTLVPVLLFYFLRDWHTLLEKAHRLLPRRWITTVDTLTSQSDAVLGEFMRGQVLVMMLMSVLYWLGLSLVGLDYALPVGIVAGCLVFIPYVGMIVGLFLATLSGIIQFGHLSAVWPVWVVFGIGQMLEGFVVTPWLVGDRIGLHPVAVIFALMAFGQLFGFVGVLLALPLAAVTLVLIRYVSLHYRRSSLYRYKGDGSA